MVDLLLWYGKPQTYCAHARDTRLDGPYSRRNSDAKDMCSTQAMPKGFQGLRRDGSSNAPWLWLGLKRGLGKETTN